MAVRALKTTRTSHPIAQGLHYVRPVCPILFTQIAPTASLLYLFRFGCRQGFRPLFLFLLDHGQGRSRTRLADILVNRLG